MLKTFFFFCSSLIPILTQNFGLSEGVVVERWMKVYKDHYDPTNDETWSMRYYGDNQFYDPSGPIFILIGGESEITPDFVTSNTFLYEIAEAHGAMIYVTEHRYYGKSHPVPDTSLNNLAYLSVRQALADVAFFIDEKKQQLNDPDAFIMVIGYSYSGNLAAWMRVRYSYLVQGAIASSAPVYVKSDFFEFYERVEDAYRKHDENCARNIKEGFSTLEELLKNPANNSVKLVNDFRFYRTPDFQQLSEVGHLILNLAEIFGFAAVHDRIEANGRTSIGNLCTQMTKNGTTSPYDGLVGIFREKKLMGTGTLATYQYLVNKTRETSWESTMTEARLWLYQTCTELGYHQTLSSPKSIFGSLVPQKYMLDLCAHVFGEKVDLDNLNNNIKQINRAYNSKLSSAKNIIFTNGELDPWRSLSVVSDLNEDSPAILNDGASHCNLLQSSTATGACGANNARCLISYMIYKWLDAHEKSH